MKRYSLFILTSLFFTNPAFSAHPTVKYSKPDNEFILSYELLKYRISSNSFMDGMYLSRSLITIDQEKNLINLQAWIGDRGDLDSVTNYLATDQCDLVFQLVVEGIAVVINANDTVGDSITSTPGYTFPISTNNALSTQNVLWHDAEAVISDLTIKYSCQGNFPDHI